MKAHAFMQEAHGRGFYGNAMLTLDTEVIGCGSAFVDIAGLFTHARDMEHTFSDRCLAGIDMGKNADVPNGERWP